MTDSRIETETLQHLRHLLIQHGLPDWWPILSRWLPNFDGWLAVMEADDDPKALVDDSPAQEVIDLLQSFASGTLFDDILFASELASLGFLRRRARLTLCGKRWSPFEESFAVFADLEPEETPHVFEYEPYSEKITKYWLLGQLFELQFERLQTKGPFANGKHAAAHP